MQGGFIKKERGRCDAVVVRRRSGGRPRRPAAGRTASAPPAPIAADAASPIATYIDASRFRARQYHRNTNNY